MDAANVVYLFGDQTVNCSHGLSSLLRGPKGPLLDRFLDEAYLCLRAAIHLLPPTQRRQLARSASLEDLIQNSSSHPALQQALTCIYHLACFILHCEQNGGRYPDPDQTVLVGLCTGAFAAAAIGCCSTLSELLHVAVHTVELAFNTGLCAQVTGETIVQTRSQSGPAPWSIVVHGLTMDDASALIGQFNSATSRPLTSQPWISAVSHKGVTISGPPDTLSDLKHFHAFPARKSASASIFAPYHATHIFNDAMVDSILEQGQSSSLAGHTSRIPTLSSSSGAASWSGNAYTMLRMAILDSLAEPVRWDRVTDGVAARIQTSAASRVNIYAIATAAGQALSSAIASTIGPENVLVEVEAIHGVPSCASENTQGQSRRPKLAIVGFSGRFPESDNVDEYWKILVEGLDVHKPVPDFHWDIKTHVDPEGKRKNTSATPYGCWLKQPGAFDANFFNMSPREAPQVDPAQRIALMTAYEAMENAGMVPDATPSSRRDRVGVFYGVAANDWMETNSGQNIGQSSVLHFSDTYYMPGGNRAFIPGRINYFFKYTGPSYSVDTACSSSLASFHLACNALWAGEVDTAFAGGCNIVTNPDLTAGLDRGHFLSRTGNCKTFDETADGYCRAEGVVTVIVKRLEDAIQDHDPIHAVIRGASTNHSSEADSITRPYVGAQKAVFRKILDIAGVDPVDVDYVEMHGTGTKTGDPGEMQSVLDVFAPPAPCGRRRDQPLHIGSVKPNIGHMEAASGLSSLVKVLLMLKNDVIVPHTGIKTRLNPNFPKDLDARQVFISQQLKPWARPTSGSRKAFVNNFSAAGGNSGLLLEDPPRQSRISKDPRSHFPVAVSGKSAAALQRNLERLLVYCEKNGAEDGFLPALSYTTTARRTHYQHRAIVSGSDMRGVQDGLRQAIATEQGALRVRSLPKVVFAFTGQGSQYAGMGAFLFKTFALFREEVTRMDWLAQRQGFSSFLPALMSDAQLESYSPTVVQLATVALEIALARLWISWGVQPTSVVGHSLGEYAALCITGVLSVADTIHLVGGRAQLLEKYCRKGSHAMLAVRASVQTIESVLGAAMPGIACINGPQDTVLAGRTQDVAQAQQLLHESHLKSTLLKVPFAFHSSQVDPILEEFVRLATGVQYSSPIIPIMCPLMGTADRKCGTPFSAEYLRSHCRQTVNMLDSLRSAVASELVDDKTFVLEIGPQPVVSSMFTATLGRGISTLPSLHKSKEASGLIVAALSALYQAGVAVDWQEYSRGYAYEVLALPNYSWDLKNYWIQYVNDWSLYKGDPVYKETFGGVQVEPNGPDRTATTLATSSVHTIVSDDTTSADGELIAESDLSRPDFNLVVRGHKVEGLDLCTPSVYADIAFTIGNYLTARKSFSSDHKIDVADLIIARALVINDKAPQRLRTTVKLGKGGQASCSFATVDATGKELVNHATCMIQLQHEQSSTRDIAAIKRRIDELGAELSQGKAFRFNRSMAYRMVSDYVAVEPTFRGLSSVLLNSDSMDAYGTVDFTGISPATGEFHAHPAVIDAFTQLPGFILNANDGADVQHEVFVNHSWQSMQLFKPIAASEKYYMYVKMTASDGGMWSGDLTVLDSSDCIVALIDSIALRAVPRRLLKYVFTEDSRAATRPDASPLPTKGSAEAADTMNAGHLDIVACRLGSNSTAKHDTSAVSSNTPAVLSPGLPNGSTSSVGPTQIGISRSKPETSVNALLPTRPGDNSANMVDAVLKLFAEESGIATEALTDESRFDDLGVDSLLSLLIVNRLDEEMRIGLDSAAFAHMETVKDLKDYVSARLPSLPPAARTGAANIVGSSASSSVLQSDSALDSGTETPLTEVEESDRTTKFL